MSALPRKPRLLFVDDERYLLDGLRDLLRRERREWDMVFALGGEAAITECERGPFDVIVSDMRMPGLDGAQLLGIVRERWPRTARVVLSGYAENETMLRVSSLAHQFLSKPCEGEKLKAVLRELVALEAAWPERVRTWVNGVQTLPPAPAVYLELVGVSERPTSSAADFAEVIERDPALTSLVLRLVNSPFFSSVQDVVTVRDAVMRLGSELVKALALSSAVTQSRRAAVPGLSLDTLQQDALLVARVAHELPEAPRDREIAFSAALVSELGLVLFATADPEGAAEVARRLDGRPRWQVEREVLGVCHGEAGAYLLSLWGLPRAVCEVVMFHDVPGEAPNPTTALAAVHAARALVHHPEAPALDHALLQRLGLERRATRWADLARQLLDPKPGASS